MTYKPCPYRYFGTLGNETVWLRKNGRTYQINIGLRCVGLVTRAGKLYRAPDGRVGDRLTMTVAEWIKRQKQYDGLPFHFTRNLRASESLPNVLVALQPEAHDGDAGAYRDL